MSVAHAAHSSRASVSAVVRLKAVDASFRDGLAATAVKTR